MKTSIWVTHEKHRINRLFSVWGLKFLKKKKLSVFLGNGLGNQIFTYVYILNLFQRHQIGNLKIEIILSRNTRAWTQFYLEDLISLRGLPIKIKIGSGIGYFFRSRVPQGFSHWTPNPEKFLKFFRIYFERRYFLYDEELLNLPTNSVIYGTFISRIYVENVHETILNDLVNWLHFYDEPAKPFLVSPGENITLHVRRGDTVTSDPSKSRGIIGIDYYQNALKSIFAHDPHAERLSISVITDDLQTTKKELADLNVDYWFGPESLEPVSALNFAANSKYFVGCNSTLSWWAAYLVVNVNSGFAVMPHPWYSQSSESENSNMQVRLAAYLNWNPPSKGVVL